MFTTLRVGEVGAVVLMDCETETALEGADVVFEEVRVFVEVDGFESEFAQAFTPVGGCCFFGGDATAAKLGAGAVLVVHGYKRLWRAEVGVARAAALGARWMRFADDLSARWNLGQKWCVETQRGRGGGSEVKGRQVRRSGC